VDCSTSRNPASQRACAAREPGGGFKVIQFTSPAAPTMTPSGSPSRSERMSSRQSSASGVKRSAGCGFAPWNLRRAGQAAGRQSRSGHKPEQQLENNFDARAVFEERAKHFHLVQASQGQGWGHTRRPTRQVVRKAR
jgi:hypothetical protein